MSYNANCYYQSCWTGCCNVYGYCPSDTSGCYYYYSSYYSYSSNTSSTSPSIAGIIAGPIVAFFVLLIIGIVVFRYCRARHTNALQQQLETTNNCDGTTMIIVTDPNNGAYGQPVNQNNYQQNSYGNVVTPMPYNQPVYQNQYAPNNSPYQQQVYPPYQQPPAYNAQPAYYNTPQQQGPIIVV